MGWQTRMNAVLNAHRDARVDCFVKYRADPTSPRSSLEYVYQAKLVVGS